MAIWAYLMGISFFVIGFVKFAVNASLLQFTSSMDLLNLAFDERTIWTTPKFAKHLGDCGFLCGKEDNCLSFTYNSDTQQCKGHDYVFRHDEGIPQNGAQYFHSKRCGAPKAIPHADFELKPKTYGPIYPGATAEYICHQNYRNYGGNLNIRCQENGQWTVMEGKCEPETVTVCYCDGKEVSHLPWQPNQASTISFTTEEINKVLSTNNPIYYLSNTIDSNGNLTKLGNETEEISPSTNVFMSGTQDNITDSSSTEKANAFLVENTTIIHANSSDVLLSQNNVTVSSNLASQYSSNVQNSSKFSEGIKMSSNTHSAYTNITSTSSNDLNDLSTQAETYETKSIENQEESTNYTHALSGSQTTQTSISDIASTQEVSQTTLVLEQSTATSNTGRRNDHSTFVDGFTSQETLATPQFSGATDGMSTHSQESPKFITPVINTMSASTHGQNSGTVLTASNYVIGRKKRSVNEATQENLLSASTGSTSARSTAVVSTTGVAGEVSNTGSADVVTTTYSADVLTSTGSLDYVSTKRAADEASTTGLAGEVTITGSSDVVTTTESAGLVTTKRSADVASTTGLAGEVTTTGSTDVLTSSGLSDHVTTKRAIDVASTTGLAGEVTTTGSADVPTTTGLAGLVTSTGSAEVPTTTELAGLVTPTGSAYVAPTAGSSDVNIPTNTFTTEITNFPDTTNNKITARSTSLTERGTDIDALSSSTIDSNLAETSYKVNSFSFIDHTDLTTGKQTQTFSTSSSIDKDSTPWIKSTEKITSSHNIGSTSSNNVKFSTMSYTAASEGTSNAETMLLSTNKPYHSTITNTNKLDASQQVINTKGTTTAINKVTSSPKSENESASSSSSSNANEGSTIPDGKTETTSSVEIPTTLKTNTQFTTLESFNSERNTEGKTTDSKIFETPGDNSYSTLNDLDIDKTTSVSTSTENNFDTAGTDSVETSAQLSVLNVTSNESGTNASRTTYTNNDNITTETMNTSTSPSITHVPTSSYTNDNRTDVSKSNTSTYEIFSSTLSTTNDTGNSTLGTHQSTSEKVKNNSDRTVSYTVSDTNNTEFNEVFSTHSTHINISDAFSTSSTQHDNNTDSSIVAETGSLDYTSESNVQTDNTQLSSSHSFSTKETNQNEPSTEQTSASTSSCYCVTLPFNREVSTPDVRSTQTENSAERSIGTPNLTSSAHVPFSSQEEHNYTTTTTSQSLHSSEAQSHNISIFNEPTTYEKSTTLQTLDVTVGTSTENIATSITNTQTKHNEEKSSGVLNVTSSAHVPFSSKEELNYTTTTSQSLHSSKAQSQDLSIFNESVTNEYSTTQQTLNLTVVTSTKNIATSTTNEISSIEPVLDTHSSAKVEHTFDTRQITNDQKLSSLSDQAFTQLESTENVDEHTLSSVPRDVETSTMQYSSSSDNSTGGP